MSVLWIILNNFSELIKILIIRINLDFNKSVTSQDSLVYDFFILSKEDSLQKEVVLGWRGVVESDQAAIFNEIR